MQESNPRLPEYKTGALPAELMGRRLLKNQESQGLEPWTIALSRTSKGKISLTDVVLESDVFLTTAPDVGLS